MANRSYQKAFEELQQIVTQIEGGEIHVDELLEMVSRASELIKVCKAKLRTTEENVQKVLNSLQENDQQPDNEEQDTDQDVADDGGENPSTE